jgi:hypothetical protein
LRLWALWRRRPSRRDGKRVGAREVRHPNVFAHCYLNNSAGFIADLKEEYIPGDLGFDPLGIAPKTEEGFTEMQTKELNNGRLAMIAIAGQVAQELVDGKGLIEHLTT